MPPGSTTATAGQPDDRPSPDRTRRALGRAHRRALAARLAADERRRAVLRAEVRDLEERVERAERRRAAIIEQYERILADSRRGEDEDASDDPDGAVGQVLARLTGS